MTQLPASSGCHVRQITAGETIPIRLEILRSGLPREFAVFPGDDDPETRHFGAFDHVHDCLSGVASIYRAALPERPDISNAWQLRGMAALPEVRRRGFGKALLAACVSAVMQQNGNLLWCNARSSAISFYTGQGWSVLGVEFDIPTAGPHCRMMIRITPEDSDASP